MLWCHLACAPDRGATRRGRGHPQGTQHRDARLRSAAAASCCSRRSRVGLGNAVAITAIVSPWPWPPICCCSILLLASDLLLLHPAARATGVDSGGVGAAPPSARFSQEPRSGRRDPYLKSDVEGVLARELRFSVPSFLRQGHRPPAWSRRRERSGRRRSSRPGKKSATMMW